jgi:Uma2 family endonuclease
MPETRPVTAEDLLALGEGRRELIAGRVVEMTPAGAGHGAVGMTIGAAVLAHAQRTAAGVVFAADTGFRLARDPDTVRAPDVAFVAAPRLLGVDLRRYFPGAPDLAVEIVSPGDSFRDVEAKARQWIEHGARLVWVVEPEDRVAFVYRPGRPREDVPPAGALSGDDVLPGLSIPLSECFPA